jgi:hypothetical protein
MFFFRYCQGGAGRPRAKEIALHLERAEAGQRRMAFSALRREVKGKLGACPF